MEKGSVIVDVAIDQGGCVETSHPTTWKNPVYIVDGILHFCVTNIPGIVPRSSTFALVRETLPFIEEIVSRRKLIDYSESLKNGVSIYKGKVIHPAVSEAFQIKKWDLEEVL